MKKLTISITVLMMLVLGLSLTGCKKDSNSNDNLDSNQDELIDLSNKVLINKTSSDEVIIPDKYNTGCKGELETVSLDPETQKTTVNDILFICSGGTTMVLDFYYRNKTVEDNSIIYFENKDFTSMPLTCYHENLVSKNIKVVFNNCKFKTMSTGKMPCNLSYEFNNCSFNSFYGSNSVFNRCQFGENFSDGIVPFYNIEVNDCFFKDMQGPVTDKNAHTDGTQIYGYNKKDADGNIIEQLDVEEVYYNNCRFEIPPLHTKGSTAYINACIMLQLEYSNAKNLQFNNCIANGGGYTIYARSKFDNLTQTNVSFNGIKYGCASKYGIVYSDIYPTIEFNDIEQVSSLYIGSVWKENGKTHFSVTNDTNQERVLSIQTDKGDFNYTIPACLKNNQMTEDMIYSDFPFDLDIVIDEDVNYAVCYDTNVNGPESQIRFVNWTNEIVYLDKDVVDELTKVSIDIISEGSCGKNITYKLTADGTLTLSGTGYTDNYHSAKFPGWYDYKNEIKKVIVEEGIEGLGSMIFRTYSSIETVSLPSTLIKISSRAFQSCISLKEFIIPENVTTIDSYAFSGVILKEIHYTGDSWNMVTVGTPNDELLRKIVLDNPQKETQEDTL